MAIELQTLDQVKHVEKPWGYEKWIQAGSNDYPYVLKELCLKAGQRTSLQVHRWKAESIIILNGTGTLLTSDVDFNCLRYLNNEYKTQELEDIVDNLREIFLSPGMVFHTPPGTIHRMVATTDLIYIEASTTELDDVIRLQDDKNRQHGRIDSEHK
jgi:quercetin dioxygenase-like cupin family protein